MNDVTLHDILGVMENIDKKLDGFSNRISAIEVWKAEVAGKIGMLVFIATVGINILWNELKTRIRIG